MCVGSQGPQLTRADVRDEVRDALAQFAKSVLRQELDQLGTAVRESFRVTLDDLLPKVMADPSAATFTPFNSSAVPAGGAAGHKVPSLKSDGTAESQPPSDRTNSTNTGGFSPPRSPADWTSASPSPSGTPFMLPAGLSCAESLELPTPFSLPQSTPATPTMTFTAMPPSRTSRKDWRRSYVERTTKVNRKIEYLHESQCRDTHEVNDAIEEAIKALEDGIKPHLVEDGLGGTYFVKGRRGDSIAVFKPRDEEPLAPNNPKEHASRGSITGLKEGVLVGEAAINEYTAFLLDQAAGASMRAGVCPTALVRMEDSAFHFANEDRHSAFRKIKDKVGSFQVFAQHDCTSEDMGPGLFPVDQVHRLAALDIRLCNTDRHAGNILVQTRGGEVTGLVPIDHGYGLPAAVGEATFEWLSWPAAKEPFGEAIRRDILTIDVEATEALLRRRVPMMRAECLRTLRACTALLQRGVEAGLTAYDIGTLMIRQDDYDDDGAHPRPSELEALVAAAAACAVQDCAPDAAPEARASLEMRHLDRLAREKCAEVAAAAGRARA